jgi:hypothetical protein
MRGIQRGALTCDSHPFRQKLSLFSATVTLEACLDETQARLPGKSDDVASIVIPRRRISCQRNVTPTQGRMDRPCRWFISEVVMSSAPISIT